MNDYLNISESIEELSEGEIQKRRKKLIIPIICIIIGLISCIIGITKWNQIGFEQTSYILVFAGLFIVGGGIVMICSNTQYFVYVQTGEIVKPQMCNLDPEKEDIIMELLNKGKLNDVLGYQIKKNSPLMLELWKIDGHKLIYSQLLYNNNFRKKPISTVNITDKKETSL